MKKISVLLLAILMVFAFVSCDDTNKVPEEPTEEIAKWNGNLDTDWYNNTDSTFELSTPEQLAGLAKLVNDGNDFAGKTIKLITDIDLDNKAWTPIGKAIIPFTEEVDDVYFATDETFNAFSGTFDGGEHTIYNLFLDDKVEESLNLNYHKSFKGLFGAIKAGSTIKNLTIENVDLTGDSFNAAFVGYIPSSETVKEPAILENLTLQGKAEFNTVTNTAGIVGRNETKATVEIKNCTVKVEDGSYIKDINNKNDSTNFFGGIIGVAYSSSNKISNCSVDNLDIIGNIEAVGGIAGGIAKGTILNCDVSNMEISLKNSTGNDGLALGAFSGVIIAGKDEVNVLDLQGSTAKNIILEKAPTATEKKSFSKLVGTYRSDSIETENVTKSLSNHEDIDISSISYK